MGLLAVHVFNGIFLYALRQVEEQATIRTKFTTSVAGLNYERLVKLATFTPVNYFLG
jgi:hypothetical protein